MRVKDAVGRFGEQVACEHLEAAGYRILERNWRCPAGEIDALALDGTTLVVAEVKTRSSDRFGAPMEAVDRPKQVRLRRLAALWMASDAAGCRSWDAVRFDVLSVVRSPTGAGVTVTHVRDAF